ncbi:hypothetical protein [Bradyrhizobium sp.]|uniref:hypothetical protein n=1 Tax=Bradyrhizobium sp. TaxID=376 RepID=UPI002DF8AD96|nr:hypothetical protein [Bradyrhizobium sp.]
MGHEADNTFSVEKLKANSLKAEDGPYIMITGCLNGNIFHSSFEGEEVSLAMESGTVEALKKIQQTAYSAFASDARPPATAHTGLRCMTSFEAFCSARTVEP